MLTKLIQRKMTSKVLRNLLSETFAAGGSQVNLINEEGGRCLKGHAENKRKVGKPTRVKAMGRGRRGPARSACCFKVKEGWAGSLDLLDHAT